MGYDTVRTHLEPTPGQRQALEATFEAFGQACREAMAVGRREGTTGNAVIHRLCYRRLRQAYGLSANLTVRAIAWAARALKEPNVVQPDAIEYDARIFSVDGEAQRLSLSTVAGRVQDLRLHVAADGRQRLQAGRPVGATLRRVGPGQYEFLISIQKRVRQEREVC